MTVALRPPLFEPLHGRQERIELAKKEPTFWQDYKFVNPTSKKVEPKQMYCERLNQTAVCGGVYKF